MTPERKFAIPKGSTVLVTGANGFIGSHVCNELLQLGFNVRGTVRDVSKCAWLPEALKRQRQKGDFMLVSLPDMEKECAFDAAIEGVSAVIHAASPVSFSPNPESVIPRSITVALNALKAANKAASVKRFIFTSSSVAAALPQPEKKGIEVNSDCWNTESVEIAWREAPCHPQRAWHIYAASKVEAEMAVWKFYHENIRRRYDLIVSSEYFVDVEDNARLHVAAAVLPNVRSERIFAWAEPFNFDTVLDILRTHFPEKNFVDNFHHYRELSVVSQPQSRAVELLRQLGRDGFVPLKQSVLLNVEDLS
ncbi:hypothetical protein COL516b_001630 [Colletotrichum fioriniae]|nr:uncharacterized protein COL516b_001630 [Colletotrichum fioriniae]KAJ0310930.1 hypothetical protein COL516b_001630 [Colletotrichum fioriniae]